MKGFKYHTEDYVMLVVISNGGILILCPKMTFQLQTRYDNDVQHTLGYRTRFIIITKLLQKFYCLIQENILLLNMFPA